MLLTLTMRLESRFDNSARIVRTALLNQTKGHTLDTLALIGSDKKIIQQGTCHSRDRQDQNCKHHPSAAKQRNMVNFARQISTSRTRVHRFTRHTTGVFGNLSNN